MALNILVVTPFYYEPPQKKIGLMRLMQELSKHAKVVVLSTQIEGAKKYEEPNKNLKIYRVKPLLYFSSLPYFISPSLLREIIKIYRQENIHIVINVTEYFWSSLMAALAKRICKFPLVSWVHGFGRGIEMPAIDVIRWAFDKTLSKFVINSADKVFILTRSLGERTAYLNYKGDVAVVPNGIDTNKFRPDIECNHLRKEFGIGEREKVITFLGRFYPLKGVKYLMDASRKVLSEYPNCKFLMLGDGPLKKEMIRMAGEIAASKFVFPGERNDIPEFLNLTYALVLPSLTEGLPTSILEAYACGVPVIGTNTGGIPDILKDGKNGFLVPVKNSEAISKKILTLLNDDRLRSQMGNYNREYVIENYSLEKVAEKVLREVKGLVKNAAL